MVPLTQPPFVAAVPETSHLQRKPSYKSVLMSASTTASSRSASLSDPEEAPFRLVRRSKTVGGINGAECGGDYRLSSVARDSDDGDDDGAIRKNRRSKTTPDLNDHGLANVYPTNLVVRNTFLEFVEEPDLLQMRRIKSAPSSPLGARGTRAAPKDSAVLELTNLIDTPPNSGIPAIPSVGSTQHHLGNCKPCAFFWKPPGCSNGANCVYCHLCDANEKKRRQKEKKALFKVAH